MTLSPAAEDLLAKAARRLDGQLYTAERTTYADGMAAANAGIALQHRGLARWGHNSRGYDTLVITDAGRRYVEQRRAA